MTAHSPKTPTQTILGHVMKILAPRLDPHGAQARLFAEALVRLWRSYAAAGGALEVALHDEVGLVHVFERAGVLADGDGEPRIPAARPGDRARRHPRPAQRAADLGRPRGHRSRDAGGFADVRGPLWPCD